MKNSAAFSGSNYLSVANFTGNPAAFSVSCWANVFVDQLNTIFFSNYQPSGSKGWVVGTGSPSNSIRFYLGGSTLTSATILTSRVWNHVIITHDGTTAKIYLNGNTTPVASVATAVSYGTVPTNNYTGILDGSVQGLVGALVGLGYWSKALSTTEVTSLYNSGNGLTFADLSGTLLTSLGAYYDFANAGSLGTDSSAGAANMSNTGSVAWYGVGPSGSVYASPPLAGPPPRLAVNPRWRSGLVGAVIPGPDAGNIVGVRDVIAGIRRPFVSGAMTRATGMWGPELVNAHTGVSAGVGFATGTTANNPLTGATQFTLASLCLWDGVFNEATMLWGGDNTSTADMRFLLGSTGVSQGAGWYFQLGADGSFTNLTTFLPPVNQYVMVTARLAPGGVRSIWMGPYKLAERTDAAIVYGTGTESNGMGWGGSPEVAGRSWSGRLTTGYVWNRALSDAEIVALAGDPFAPVRPNLSRAWAPLTAGGGGGGGGGLHPLVLGKPYLTIGSSGMVL